MNPEQPRYFTAAQKRVIEALRNSATIRHDGARWLVCMREGYAFKCDIRTLDNLERTGVLDSRYALTEYGRTVIIKARI